MHNGLKTFYSNLKSTKQYLFSHALILWGWGYIALLFEHIRLLEDRQFLYVIDVIVVCPITIYLFIIWICFIVVEIKFLSRFRIKQKFLLQNPYYNIIWTIGIITAIFFISIILVFFIHCLTTK